VALADVRKDLTTNIGKKITPKAKAELSKLGLEQYSFKKYYILEWCEFVLNELSLTGTGGRLARSMAASFYKSLKSSVKRSATPYHLYMSSDGMVVTQLNVKAVGFQGNRSDANTMVRDAKRAAINKIETLKLANITDDDKSTLMSQLHGHHAGVVVGGTKGRRTTGGVLQTKKEQLERTPTAGGDIEDLMSDADQRVPEQALYDVVITQLGHWLDLQLGFDQTPKSVLTYNKSKKTGTKHRFLMQKIIYIEFALGSGTSVGKEYTAAMNDWDAGGGGRFSRQLDRALDKIEKRITKQIENNILSHAYDLIKLKGSPSIQDHIVGAVPAYILANLVMSKGGTIDKRFKVNRKALRDYPQLSKLSERDLKIAIQGSVKKIKRKPIQGGSKGNRAKRHHASTDHPLALREMINAVLPDEILKQMGSPALVNRTGRFRQSARVTNVLTGPRGGVQIDYTYQRNPYEVFEPGSGSPLANQYRDPRKIIGQTVREVAQELMGKKFIKVRRV